MVRAQQLLNPAVVTEPTGLPSHTRSASQYCSLYLLDTKAELTDIWPFLPGTCPWVELRYEHGSVWPHDLAH